MCRSQRDVIERKPFAYLFILMYVGKMLKKYQVSNLKKKKLPTDIFLLYFQIVQKIVILMFILFEKKEKKRMSSHCALEGASNEFWCFLTTFCVDLARCSILCEFVQILTRGVKLR